VIGALTIALPGATTATADPADGAQSAAPVTSEADAQSASTAAKRQGSPVEVLGDRTDSSQTFANPDGSFSYETFAVPKWTQRDGAWQDLDATLTRTDSGGWSPKVSQAPLVLSDGGSGPLAAMTVNGNDFSVTWPTALPAPTASGATLTYADVLPGVDLHVTAEVTGAVEETLVIKDADAAADPGLDTLLQQVNISNGDAARTDAGGNLTVTDPQGDVVVTSPAPVMWDSSTDGTDGSASSDGSDNGTDASAPAPSGGGAVATESRAGGVVVARFPDGRRAKGTRSTASMPGSRARQARVGMRLRQHRLALTPDPALLRARSTVYPVYVDPTFLPHLQSGGTLHFDEVQQAYPGTSNYDDTPSGGNAVGYQGFSAPTGIERSYYKLALPADVDGATIVSARLRTTVSYAAESTSNSTTVKAWATCAISSSTTWNNQPCKSSTTAADSETFTTKSQKPDLQVDFDLSPEIQSAADADKASYTVGLFNGTETNDDDLVRFADNPSFILDYDHTPGTPASLSVSPEATVNGVVHTSSTTPTFSATSTDADGDSLNLDFRILSGQTTVASGTSEEVLSGSPATYTPDTALTPGDYTWEARADDGWSDSSWSSAHAFTVDDETPAVPIDLTTSATDTTTPTLSGVVYGPSDGAITGDIYLTDDSGEAVIATPTATGTVPSGERVTYQVPGGTLTPGATYHWSMTACDGAQCSAASPTQTFTAGSSTSTAPPAAPANATTLTLGTSAFWSEDANSDADACGGADCAVVSSPSGGFKVGGDGSAHWVSALWPDLSAIPTGSTVYQATLGLTRKSCLGDCGTDTLDVSLPSALVTGVTDGNTLLGDADTSDPVHTGPEDTSTVDVTDLVSSWVTGGDEDDGLVLSAADEATATGGAVLGATLTVTYTTPTTPGAPTGEKVVPGDGGALVTWSPPTDTGVQDSTDNTANGIGSYTVTATDQSGKVAATTTTQQNQAVLTGLTDGSAYTFSVTAANTVGTGPAAAATGSPIAVTGGPTAYVQAVKGYLNAQDQLQESTTTLTPHVQSALVASAFPATVSFGDELEAVAPANEAVATDEAANDQSDTDDTTALSGTLVIPSTNGTSVTVYTTADETFTTVDTSDGSTQSVPGENETDQEFFFTTSSSTPYLLGSVDADEALSPLADAGNLTATTNDGTSDDDSDDTSSFTVDSSGTITAAPDLLSPINGGGWGDPGIAKYAKAHYNDKHNTFSDDCTDFVSKSMHYGAGFDMNSKWYLHNNWFHTHSKSWAVAKDLYTYQKQEGAAFTSRRADWAPGEIVFVNWDGGGSSNIDHAAVITKMIGNNPFISQHTRNVSEPIFKISGKFTWQKSRPHLRIWVAQAYS
jgi:hypothetical protein